MTVVWINLQASLLKMWVDECTRDDGRFFPGCHPHRLFLEEGVYCHWCDVCNTRIPTAVGRCYRCKLCDFDCCLKCVVRTDAGTVGEGLMRTDAGAVEQSEMTTMQYFGGSIKLARNEW